MPEQYCIGVNGHRFIVKHYDSDAPLYSLSFADFTDGNPAFTALREAHRRLEFVITPPTQAQK